MITISSPEQKLKPSTVKSISGLDGFRSALLLGRIDDSNRIQRWSENQATLLSKSRANEAFEFALSFSQNAETCDAAETSEYLRSLLDHLDAYSFDMMIDIENPLGKRDALICNAALFCVQTISHLFSLRQKPRESNGDILRTSKRCIICFTHALAAISEFERNAVEERMADIANFLCSEQSNNRGAVGVPVSRELCETAKKEFPDESITLRDIADSSEDSVIEFEANFEYGETSLTDSKDGSKESDAVGPRLGKANLEQTLDNNTTSLDVPPEATSPSPRRILNIPAAESAVATRQAYSSSRKRFFKRSKRSYDFASYASMSMLVSATCGTISAATFGNSAECFLTGAVIGIVAAIFLFSYAGLSPRNDKFILEDPPFPLSRRPSLHEFLDDEINP